MRRWPQILLGGLVMMFAQAQAQPAPEPMPKPSAGKIERLTNFASKFVDARHVDVWLPEGYSASKRYQVLYMQDGQMLFDASTTWNKQAWGVDAVISRLRKEGRITDTLVVGVWNNGKWRHSEYYPQKFLPFVAEPFRQEFVSKALADQPRADAYLRFLVEELKPAIDAKYATLPSREHTFVMGSSMGGLISIYAMNEYPQVFGGAAGLSTHWIGTGQANAALPLAAFNYLREKLASPTDHRLYMDRGTAELDANYATSQSFVDQIVLDKGYTTSNSMSLVFEGAGHNEKAWSARLEVSLVFLLRAR